MTQPAFQTGSAGAGSRRLLQCLRRLPDSGQAYRATQRIASAYAADTDPWIVGYSGGKDSTALLKLVFQGLLRSARHHKSVTVIYCDTGVEIPIASSLAKTVLAEVRSEALRHSLPIRTAILSPPLEQRFFVKVLGRGYPPPTDKFRWCTDRLRINPVTAFLRGAQARGATVLLGVRESESATRKHTLRQNESADRYWRTQRGVASRRLFLPILDFSTEDVWHTNLLVSLPHSARAHEVADLYADAAGECPTVRDAKGAPCGKARFGCWTCTVAKNAVTLRNLVNSGARDLKPLLDFRLWLGSTRDSPSNRWRRRRNGSRGPGPMTLSWRRLGLSKLLEAQAQSGLPLIGEDEIAAIHSAWARE